MPDTITLIAIGQVAGGRSEPIDDDWDSVEAAILLDPGQFKADATASLSEFSHIEVVFHFNQVPDEEINKGARHPRGRKDWPLVGIFAQRGKNRPNRLGVTTCRLLAVEGLNLHVKGLDAIEGSPVLDIKPYMSGFAPRGPLREPPWAKEVMAAYW